MPLEVCLQVGNAAKYTIDRGTGRQISKDEAIRMVKEFQNMGCVHQTGRTIPLKNFKNAE
jgi:hypothetical protein